MDKHEAIKYLIHVAETGYRVTNTSEIIDKYIQEFKQKEKDLEDLSIKSVSQYQKDSKLIGILESRIIGLEKNEKVYAELQSKYEELKREHNSLMIKYIDFVFAHQDLKKDVKRLFTIEPETIFDRACYKEYQALKEKLWNGCDQSKEVEQ